MPHPVWDNLDDFLSLDEFAIQASFTPKAGQENRFTPFSCAVIFDEPFYDVKLGEYVQDAAEPRFTAKARDVKVLKKYDTVVFDGIPVTFYLTHDPLFDGVGMAVVHLARDLGETS